MGTNSKGKFGYIPHDEEKHPRKFRGNLLRAAVMIVLFISITYSFKDFLSRYSIGKYMILAIPILCALSFAAIGFWKWKKNDKEFDWISLYFALFSIATIFIFKYPLI